MVATTDFIPAVVSKAIAKPSTAVADIFQRFALLSVDDRLALLWLAYKQMGQSITPAAPGAARMQLAEGLLARVRDMGPQDQLQFMRNLVNRVSTPETRAYGVFSANTKLGFWYQLAVWMDEGTVIAYPSSYRFSSEGQQVLAAISILEMNQQITLLRSIATNMGVDPLA